METEDLYDALVLLLIGLSARMPDDLKAALKQRLHQLYDDAHHAGNPDVARIGKALADTLAAPSVHRPPRH